MSYGSGTLLDLSRLSNKVPASVIHTIINAQPLLDQMCFTMSNDGANNRSSVITDYPEGQFRRFNQGTKPEKAGGITQVDPTCMLNTWSKIDAKELKLNGGSAEWRYNQEKPFQRGIAHKVARTIFCGSLKADPDSINGLRTRYGKTGAGYEDVVINAGGEASASKGLTDIFIVNWDRTLVHAIYPEGGVGGLQMTDRGEQDAYDDQGRRYRAVITDYDWDLGLAVEDRRQVVRIANIDVASLTADASGSLDLVDMLIDAVEMFPESLGAGAAMYMTAPLRAMLRKQIRHCKNVNLDWETVAGRKVVSWDGIPVHKLPTSILPNYAKPI